jgi:hypothetical protein
MRGLSACARGPQTRGNVKQSSTDLATFDRRRHAAETERIRNHWEVFFGVARQSWRGRLQSRSRLDRPATGAQLC